MKAPQSLPAAINAAVTRCQRKSGEPFRLPQDFHLYPVLKVDSRGRCIGVDFWLARLGKHLGRGDQPLWAVGALCPLSESR